MVKKSTEHYCRYPDCGSYTGGRPYCGATCEMRHMGIRVGPLHRPYPDSSRRYPVLLRIDAPFFPRDGYWHQFGEVLNYDNRPQWGWETESDPGSVGVGEYGFPTRMDAIRALYQFRTKERNPFAIG